jgi:hypothetical protein
MERHALMPATFAVQRSVRRLGVGSNEARLFFGTSGGNAVAVDHDRSFPFPSFTTGSRKS